MEFLSDGLFSASATQTSASTLILVSKKLKNGFDLVLAQHLQARVRPQGVLREAIHNSRNLPGVDAISLRKNLSSEWGAVFTAHIFHVMEIQEIDDSDVVANTAWKYASLTAWGEASAARELSLRMHVPVHTIHSRLRLARQRGILSSPGAGSRLGN